jgi:hypothetical protein
MICRRVHAAAQRYAQPRGAATATASDREAALVVVDASAVGEYVHVCAFVAELAVALFSPRAYQLLCDHSILRAVSCRRLCHADWFFTLLSYGLRLERKG